MMRTIRLGQTAACVAVLIAAVHPAPADDARDHFQAAFAEQIRQARLTPDKADDRELAEKMLAAAKADDPAPSADLARLLCDFAYTLASAEPAGYPTAVLAMELLAEKVPDRAVYAQQKIISLYRRHYATARGDDKTEAGNLFIDLLVKLGDKERESLNFTAARGHYRQAQTLAKQMKSDRESDLDDALADLDNRERVQRKIDEWKKKLDDSPSDAEAHRQLLELYLIDLDDPAAAIGHIELGGDADQKRYIPLAAKRPADVDVQQLLELGQWYLRLAEDATAGRKSSLLDRAESYIGEFLVRHRLSDEPRIAGMKAQEQIEGLRERLSSLPGYRASKSPWIDLLRVTDPNRHWIGQPNRWSREGTSTVAKGGGAFIRIPVIPNGSYKHRMVFVYKRGEERDASGIHVYLPFPHGAVVMRVDVDDGTSFFQFRDSATKRRPALIESGREHVFDITVLRRGDEVRVTVDLDGKPYIDFNGPAADFLPFRSYTLEGDQTFAISTGADQLTLKSLHLKMLDGKATLLQPR